MQFTRCKSRFLDYRFPGKYLDWLPGSRRNCFYGIAELFRQLPIYYNLSPVSILLYLNDAIANYLRLCKNKNK